MIEPRCLIVITLSFRSWDIGDLDHSPAQRGADFLHMQTDSCGAGGNVNPYSGAVGTRTPRY
jgi:hypothetical protein